MPVSWRNEVKHINIRLCTYIFNTVVIHAFLTFQIKTALLFLSLLFFFFYYHLGRCVDSGAFTLTVLHLLLLLLCFFLPFFLSLFYIYIFYLTYCSVQKENSILFMCDVRFAAYSLAAFVVFTLIYCYCKFSS